MKTISFEYTDTKFTLRLLTLCFLTLLILVITTVNLIGMGGLILAFGVPILIFFVNKKKIKKQGIANIFASYSEFTIAAATAKVVYADIRTYQIERYNGIYLKVKFNDGKSFKLQANANFCNPIQFDTCCREFESVIQQYKANNNVQLTRKPSMFEQAWMLPFLVILTMGLAGGVIFAVSNGKSIPPTFYTSAVIVIPLWVGYLSARRKKRGN
jgi:hypothetical protein